MSHFVLSLAPGAGYRDSVIVRNPDATPVDLFVYPADGETSDTSGETYLNRTDPVRETGAWITPAVRQVTVAAQGTATVDFAVRVPADARPGDHLGALVFEPRDATQSSGGQFGVNSILRNAMPVLISVPGTAAFHVTITGATIQPRVTTHTATVVVALGDDGLSKGRSVLSVRLTDPSGTTRVEPPANCSLAMQQFCGGLDYVLPGDAIAFPFPWPHDLAPGDYSIAIMATWDGGSSTYGGVFHLVDGLAGTPLNPPAAPPAPPAVVIHDAASTFAAVVLPAVVGGVVTITLVATVAFGAWIRRRRRGRGRVVDRLA
jgi:hypothetical protein